MKIFLLEDELMLQSSVCEYLEALGHTIACFGDGKEAQKDLETNIYDLLILDINVPNIDGLNVMKDLYKNNTFTPTIFISANIDINTISEAFDLGAIDYLKKPFHLKELGLRIQKEVKNIQQHKSLHTILSKNYSFSLDNNTLFYNKEVEQLTKKKLQIINYLASNIGIIITIDILREYIWDSEPVSDATIRTEMSRLKKSLKENFIKNIKGIGYTINKYISPI